MSLLDFLGPALTTATNAAGAYQGAEASANKEREQQLMQAILMQRQEREQQIKDALSQSTMNANNARANHYQHVDSSPTKANIVRGPGGQLFDASDPQNIRPVGPTPTQKPQQPIVGSPEWQAAERFKASLVPHPQTFTPFQGTDENGKPVVRPFNTKTGEFGPTADVQPKTQNGIGGSASAQVQQARMLAAISEARLADQRMRSFEDKLLGGQKNVSPLQQAAGSLTTNLADSHSPIGALLQAGSEFGLNKNDPEYAQYLRDASTIGRAEQMISPRGGNETMVRANALLSRAGTGAMKNTIDASRMARQALFGQAGGIEQALTPQQSAKVKAGLQRIQSGETGGSGNIDLGAPKTPKKKGGKDYGIFGTPDGEE